MSAGLFAAQRRANSARIGRRLTSVTTAISSRPQTLCSIFIHTGNVPGSETMTAIATTITAETIRSRRKARAAPCRGAGGEAQHQQ